MSNARDKANIPALNFSSTGIDDNATSTAITIDSSQNVGIGTASPGRIFEVSADQSYVSIKSTNDSTGTSQIFFGDTADDNVGRINYDHSNNAMLFLTSATERMRITSSGNVGIGTSSPSGADFGSNTGVVHIKDLGSSNTGLKIEDGTAKIILMSNGTNNYFGSWSNNPLLFYTNSTERMRIDSSGNVGIGTSSPGSYKLSIQDSSNCLLKFRGGSGSGVYQQFEVNDGASNIGYLGDGANLISGGSQNDMCLRGTNNIKFAIGATQKTTINSSGLTVHGTLSKSSGSFKIDHPLENKKDTHHLVHSFVEAPQADNIYRGKIDLVNGTATVNIDTVAGMSEGTFVLLNTNIQCFTSNETGWTAVKGSVSGNTLTITAQDNTCTDTISWMVIGERQDQHMIDTDWTDENGKVIVEPLKETEQQP